MKELANFKIEPELLRKLKAIAKSQNRSFSNLMETIAIEYLTQNNQTNESEHKA